MKYIQHHFLGRTNIDLAPITRKDSESSENMLSHEDNDSESEEDIVLNSSALSADSSLSDDNDGYDEENEYTAEQLFIFINEQIICIDILYGRFCLYITYVPIFRCPGISMP